MHSPLKKLLVLGALFLVFAAPAGAVDRSLGAREFTSVGGLADAIAAYFPKIQGAVTAVQGDRITVSLGSQDGLMSGIELSLWRKGKEILHPVTGAVIGHLEEAVGSAVVTGLAQKTATAQILTRLKDPQPGDKARISPAQISLAIVPLDDDHPEIIRGLADRLDASGRFALAPADKVASFLQGRSIRDASLISALGTAVSADVAAAVGIYPAEKGQYLTTVKLFYTKDARLIDTITALLDLRSKTVPVTDVEPFFAPVREEAGSTQDLPFDARLFIAADFEGKGTQQYVFSDGRRIHIYHRDASGWSEEWAEPAPPSDDAVVQMNLDAADINGNGRPELFVTAMRNGSVSSSVYEFQEGVYRRIAQLPLFFRTLSLPGEGAVLIGRAYDPRTFYTGPVRRYTWKDGGYVPGADFPLPDGVGLYGFVIANLGEARPLLVALDATDHLLVYSRDVLLWKSQERYPSVGTTVTLPVTGIAAVLSQPAAEADRSYRVWIPGRVLAITRDGGGGEEVVLPKNGGENFGGEYSSAAIVGLGWNGTRLDERWSVSIAGAVRDVQFARATGGDRLLGLVCVPGGLFARDAIRVRAFTPQ